MNCRQNQHLRQANVHMVEHQCMHGKDLPPFLHNGPAFQGSREAELGWNASLANDLG